MNVQLRPNFFRCTAWVVAVMLVLTAITYLWQGYYENDWWTLDYMLSMLIPFLVVPLTVWFVFVPSQLEFSDSQITIKFPLRPLYMLSWTGLKYYGVAEEMLMIEFVGAGTFQIFPRAYRQSDWRMLKGFLSSTFPDKKASGYIGSRLFRWPRRKA